MTKKMCKVREIAKTRATTLVKECIEGYGETFFRVAAALIKSRPNIASYDAMIGAAHALVLIDRLGVSNMAAFANAIQAIPPVWVADLGEIDAQKKTQLDSRVSELEFSVRASNCLKNIDITFVGELVQRTRAELLKTKALGRKTMREIVELLRDDGLSLGMKLDGWICPVK